MVAPHNQWLELDVTRPNPQFAHEARTKPKQRHYHLQELLGLRNDDLANVDPVQANLLVATQLEPLRHIDISAYQRTVDEWADDFRTRLPGAETHFHQTPCDWKNDIHFFRLGVLCWFLGEVLNIRYKESHIDLNRVLYTDPSDLFVNGLIESRQGTCGNMPVLFLAMTWRLGWPVYPIVVDTHMLCRFDDGKVTHNIETTNFQNGFRSPTDEYLRVERKIPERAVRDGSELCSMTPKQTLGWYFGLRGRHHQDSSQLEPSERDYLIARALFPENRRLYGEQIGVSLQLAGQRFELEERCHPLKVARWILDPLDRLQTSATGPNRDYYREYLVRTEPNEVRLEGHR